jgi:hypothetical protein
MASQVREIDARIEVLNRQRWQMNLANRYARKGHRAGLAELGYDAEQIEKLLEPDLMGEVGYPSAQITAIRDKIMRLRKRKQALRRTG